MYDLILLGFSIFISFYLFPDFYREKESFYSMITYFVINCIPTITLLINIKNYKQLKDAEVFEYLNDNNNNEIMNNNNI